MRASEGRRKAMRMRAAGVFTLTLAWLLVSPAPAQSQADVSAASASTIDTLTPAAWQALARASGEPRIPGLTIVYLHPLGDPAHAHAWDNIIVHQTEGPAGSARHGAAAQAKNPARRGVTVWVETDGTVYWAVAESAVPLHGDGANRNDSKYIDNRNTFRAVLGRNSLGVEFSGNFPDVTKPATAEQIAAWRVLVRFLQERYGIPPERIYAHNWIDYKDARYCEGCELGRLARNLNYRPSRVRVRSTER